jgi:hypothetical protein
VRSNSKKVESEPEKSEAPLVRSRMFKSLTKLTHQVIYEDPKEHLPESPK